MKSLEVSESLDGLERQAGAILFDCDGTLVDTMPAHHRSWEETLRRENVMHPLDYEQFCGLGGMAGHLVAKEICGWFKLEHDPTELAMRKREIFLSADEDHPAIGPVADLARKAAASVLPVAVVSGGHRPAVERALRSAGLRDLFDVIVTPEDVEHGKPAPDMYLLAAERLGVAPADCLVLEDGPPGVEAAKAAGMRVVVVGPVARTLLT